MPSPINSIPIQLAPMSVMRAGAPFESDARGLPPGAIHLRFDCTTGVQATPFQGIVNPFNDPSLAVRLILFSSWDGGLTWPEFVYTDYHGSSKGIWQGSVPFLTRGTTRSINGIPQGGPYNAAFGGDPTHYKARIEILNGPVSGGCSVLEE